MRQALQHCAAVEAACGAAQACGKPLEKIRAAASMNVQNARVCIVLAAQCCPPTARLQWFKFPVSRHIGPRFSRPAVSNMYLEHGAVEKIAALAKAIESLYPVERFERRADAAEADEFAPRLMVLMRNQCGEKAAAA